MKFKDNNTDSENNVAKSLLWICNQIPTNLGNTEEDKMLKCIKIYCKNGYDTIKGMEREISHLKLFLDITKYSYFLEFKKILNDLLGDKKILDDLLGDNK